MQKELKQLAFQLGIDFENEENKYGWIISQIEKMDLPLNITKEAGLDGNVYYINPKLFEFQMKHPLIGEYRKIFNELLKSDEEFNQKKLKQELAMKTETESKKKLNQQQQKKYIQQQQQQKQQNQQQQQQLGRFQKKGQQIQEKQYDKINKLTYNGDPISLLEQGKVKQNFEERQQLLNEMKKNINVFQNATALQRFELESLLFDATQFYISVFGPEMLKLPENYDKNESYQKVTPIQVLEAIQFLNINAKEVILFWLARFYITCQLPPSWSKFINDDFTFPTYINEQKKIEMPVPPCLLYVMIQIDKIREFEKEFGSQGMIDQRAAGRYMKFYDQLHRKYEVDMSSYVIQNINFLMDKVVYAPQNQTENESKQASLQLKQNISEIKCSFQTKKINTQLQKEICLRQLQSKKLKLRDVVLITIGEKIGLKFPQDIHILQYLDEFLNVKSALNQWIFREQSDGSYFWLSYDRKKITQDYPYLDELRSYINAKQIQLNEKIDQKLISDKMKDHNMLFQIFGQKSGSKAEKIDQILKSLREETQNFCFKYINANRNNLHQKPSTQQLVELNDQMKKQNQKDKNQLNSQNSFSSKASKLIKGSISRLNSIKQQQGKYKQLNFNYQNIEQSKENSPKNRKMSIASFGSSTHTYATSSQQENLIQQSIEDKPNQYNLQQLIMKLGVLRAKDLKQNEWVHLLFYCPFNLEFGINYKEELEQYGHPDKKLLNYLKKKLKRFNKKQQQKKFTIEQMGEKILAEEDEGSSQEISSGEEKESEIQSSVHSIISDEETKNIKVKVQDIETVIQQIDQEIQANIDWRDPLEAKYFLKMAIDFGSKYNLGSEQSSTIQGNGDEEKQRRQSKLSRRSSRISAKSSKSKKSSRRSSIKTKSSEKSKSSKHRDLSQVEINDNQDDISSEGGRKRSSKRSKTITFHDQDDKESLKQKSRPQSASTKKSNKTQKSRKSAIVNREQFEEQENDEFGSLSDEEEGEEQQDEESSLDEQDKEQLQMNEEQALHLDKEQQIERAKKRRKYLKRKKRLRDKRKIKMSESSTDEDEIIQIPGKLNTYNVYRNTFKALLRLAHLQSKKNRKLEVQKEVNQYQEKYFGKKQLTEKEIKQYHKNVLKTIPYIHRFGGFINPSEAKRVLDQDSQQLSQMKIKTIKEQEYTGYKKYSSQDYSNQKKCIPHKIMQADYLKSLNFLQQGYHSYKKEDINNLKRVLKQNNLLNDSLKSSVLKPQENSVFKSVSIEQENQFGLGLSSQSIQLNKRLNKEEIIDSERKIVDNSDIFNIENQKQMNNNNQQILTNIPHLSLPLPHLGKIEPLNKDIERSNFNSLEKQKQNTIDHQIRSLRALMQQQYKINFLKEQRSKQEYQILQQLQQQKIQISSSIQEVPQQKEKEKYQSLEEQEKQNYQELQRISDNHLQVKFMEFRQRNSVKLEYLQNKQIHKYLDETIFQLIHEQNLLDYQRLNKYMPAQNNSIEDIKKFVDMDPFANRLVKKQMQLVNYIVKEKILSSLTIKQQLLFLVLKLAQEQADTRVKQLKMIHELKKSQYEKEDLEQKLQEKQQKNDNAMSNIQQDQNQKNNETTLSPREKLKILGEFEPPFDGDLKLRNHFFKRFSLLFLRQIFEGIEFLKNNDAECVNLFQEVQIYHQHMIIGCNQECKKQNQVNLKIKNKSLMMLTGEKLNQENIQQKRKQNQLIPLKTNTIKKKINVIRSQSTNSANQGNLLKNNAQKHIFQDKHFSELNNLNLQNMNQQLNLNDDQKQYLSVNKKMNQLSPIQEKSQQKLQNVLSKQLKLEQFSNHYVNQLGDPQFLDHPDPSKIENNLNRYLHPFHIHKMAKRLGILMDYNNLNVNQYESDLLWISKLILLSPLPPNSSLNIRLNELLIQKDYKQYYLELCKLLPGQHPGDEYFKELIRVQREKRFVQVSRSYTKEIYMKTMSWISLYCNDNHNLLYKQIAYYSFYEGIWEQEFKYFNQFKKFTTIIDKDIKIKQMTQREITLLKVKKKPLLQQILVS